MTDATASETAPSPPLTTGQGDRRDTILAVLVLIVVAATLGYAQFSPPGPSERDGYFHARYAQMFFERGLTREFPWTQESTWRNSFCDKEFLFHALMAPFCQSKDEPIVGARVFALLLGVAVAGLIFLVLRALKVPYPWLFALLPVCMGSAFFERYIMIRSHVLSILLCIAAMYFLSKKNWKALAVLGFVYSWSYTFPFVLLMFGAPFIAGRWLQGGGFDGKSLAAIAGGVMAGLIIHPFTPHTLETFLTLLQIVTMGFQGRETATMDLGGEIYSRPLGVFLRDNWLPVACLLALCTGLISLGKKLSAETWGACFTALFWLVMTLLFARFVEYLAPILIVATALLARDALGQMAAPQVQSIVSLALPAALICALAGHIDGAYMNRNPLSKMWEVPPRYREASAWMAKNLKPEETVVNLFWEDFPELFYDGYRQHYLWGIDPTFTLRWHEKKAQLLQGMAQQKVPLNGPIMAELFKARVMILPRRMAAQFKQLDQRNQPPWRPVYVDETCTIFVLAGPQGQPDARL